MTESVLQAKLIRKLRAVGWLAYKWTSPGRRGIPDLIVFAPDGKAYAIEVKTATGRVSMFQDREIARLLQQNVYACVIRSEEQLGELIDADDVRRAGGSGNAAV